VDYSHLFVGCWNYHPRLLPAVSDEEEEDEDSR